MNKPEKFYRFRAYFTSFTNAYPFLELIRAKTGRYYGRYLDNGGYMISWG